MPNVIGFKINGTTYEYDYDNLADIPTIDSIPTEDSTNAVQSGGVYDAIAAVQAAIPAVDATPTENSTNAIQSGAVWELKEDFDQLEATVAAISFDIVVDANGNATLERSDLTDTSEVSY